MPDLALWHLDPQALTADALGVLVGFVMFVAVMLLGFSLLRDLSR